MYLRCVRCACHINSPSAQIERELTEDPSIEICNCSNVLDIERSLTKVALVRLIVAYYLLDWVSRLAEICLECIKIALVEISLFELSNSLAGLSSACFKFHTLIYIVELF